MRCIGRPQQHGYGLLARWWHTPFFNLVCTSTVCLPDAAERKTALRFCGAPLTLAVLVLPLALSHYADTSVWNWQDQKFGQMTTSFEIATRAKGIIANDPRRSQ